MSTQKSTQTRTWASLLLLLQLITMLLPARVVSAADQPGFCDGADIQAAHVAARNVPADQPVVIPKELVDSSVFAANWGSSYKDAKVVENIISSMFLVRVGLNFNEDEFLSNYKKPFRLGELRMVSMTRSLTRC